MAHPLLLFDIHVQVSHHHKATVSANILFAAAELPGRHVSLHDVDTVLLIEGDARYLIKTDHVVLTHQPSLPSRVVDEHLGYCRLTAGDQVRVRRDLLEQVALPGSTR